MLHHPDFSSEVVSVQVWVKTGSIHEGDLIGSGLSHFLEHMLFKGTQRRDGKDISREVHALGGAINAYTTFDRTVYYIDGPSAAFAKIVDILCDIVLHSTLPDDEIESERNVILREIDMGLDDPDRQLNQALFRTAFQKMPYREPIIGHRELFSNVSSKQLRGYYHARYVPNNIAVSVAGAIRSEVCRTEIEKSFGVVPRGQLSPVIVDSEPVQLAARREEIVGDFNLFRGSVGYKAPHLSHTDSPKLDALAQAMGGGESSLLWERLRNQRNLVHYIDCRNWNPGSRGLFWISFICDPGKESDVETAISELIAEISEQGVDPKFIEKARQQALSSEINGRKTMSGQASRLGAGEVVIGDIGYSQRYLARLRSVSVADLKDVAARYLVKEQSSFVSLGPAEGDAAAEGVSKAGALEPFALRTYDSGARLLLQKDGSLPKVHFRCVFQGGPLYEHQGKRGVTTLMAELMTKDTEMRNAQEVSELIEGIGGSFSATVGNNTASFAIEVLPEYQDIAIEIITDALTQPSFAQATFETEREAQIADLKETDDEVLDYGFRILRERFFGRHPFSVNADGRIENLERLTVEDVRFQFDRVITAENLVLSVCGDFDEEVLSGKLERLLSTGLPSGAPSQTADAFQYPEVAIVEHLPMAREQSVVLLGYPDAGLHETDFIVSEVLNELFSGMSSRLFERIREDQGMAYYVGSSRVIGLEGGMFTFYAGTHPEHVAQVFQEIELEIERIKSGRVSEDELMRCKTRLRAARPMGRQTIGSRAMHAAINLTYGRPIDDDELHEKELSAVTVAGLADFAKRRFNREQRVQLTVGSLPESG